MFQKVREDVKTRRGLLLTLPEWLSNVQIYRNSINTETDSDRKRPKPTHAQSRVTRVPALANMTAEQVN